MMAIRMASAEEKANKRATRAALGTTLIKLADEGLPIVAVDADLSGSTTLGKLGAKPEYADRLFNVGIAEQNMVDVAAGLSLAGNIAFTGSFAVFGIGRAYDQIRNTVAYSKLNVKLTPTHAGLSVGPDGGSHQMMEDIALLRQLPNVTILIPADYAAAASAIELAARMEGPAYVRLGRATVPGVYADGVQLEVGKSYVIREGSDVTIAACGSLVDEAQKAADLLAAEGISAEVIDCFSIQPFDEETLIASVAKTGRVVTVEDHSVHGGLGSTVAEVLAMRHPAPCAFVGLRGTFGKSGSYEELLSYFHMDAPAIVEAVKTLMA
ncbi:MAG: transketolase C-terminal domain-containing protein [Coriobacteriaceae bacterium]|nr:transketolase C-terminal domain-containing protein [Coriobacteriaceae bacterium]